MKGERQAILWQTVVTSRGSRQPDWVRMVTACLACSHETESFSGGKNYLRRGFLIIFDFMLALSRPLWLHFPQADFGTQ